MDKLAYLGIADLFKPAELLKALSVPTEPQSNLHSKLSYLHRPKNPNCQPKDSATLTCPFSRVSKIMVRPLSWVRNGFLFKRPTVLHAHSSLFCCLHSVVGLLSFIPPKLCSKTDSEISVANLPKVKHLSHG